MADDTARTNPELERLLSDYGAAYTFPPTPDVATAVEARLDEQQGGQYRELSVSIADSNTSNAQQHGLPNRFPLPVADISPQTSRLRQVAGFAAGILAFSILALLLAMMFRGVSERSSEGEHGLVLPDADTLPDNILIAISTVYDDPEETWETKTGRVTAYDTQSGTELFAVNAGASVSAAIASGGTRLYIHSWSPTGDRDELVGVDTTTGEEIWSTTGENKGDWVSGGLPSALAVSPDGARIYLFGPNFNGSPEIGLVVPFHVEIVDAHDGDVVSEVDAPLCLDARMFPSQDGRTLYVLCLGSGWWRSIVIDVESAEVVTDLPFTEMRASIQSAIGSPDNRLLYVASAASITTIDMNQRRIIAEEPFEFIDTSTVALQLIAVSRDGKRMTAGLSTSSAPSSAPDLAGELIVLDTNTWREVDRIPIDPPVNVQTLSSGADFDSVLAARNDLEFRTQTVEQGTILRLDLHNERTVLATKPNEEILRLVTYKVRDSATEDQIAEPDTDGSHYLFTVSTVYGERQGTSVHVSGRVAAYDSKTGEEIYAIDTGSSPDAAISANGSLLVVSSLSASGNGDDLIAVDAASGRELWRTIIEYRTHWILGMGPSTLAVSADGSRIFVYGGDTSGNYGDINLIPYWVQVYDGASGELIERIDAPNCPAQLHPSPDGDTVYGICSNRGSSLSFAIDLTSSAMVAVPDLSSATSGAYSDFTSQDGRLLYTVSDNTVAIIDLNERSVIAERELDLGRLPARALRLAALSPDGQRLYIGLQTDRDDHSAAELSGEIVVIDTGSWDEVNRIVTDPPINSQTLAGALDPDSVFAARNEFLPGTSVATQSTILKLSSGGESIVLVTKSDEEILRIFSSRVGKS